MKKGSLFIVAAAWAFLACAAPQITGKTHAFIYGVSDYSRYAPALGLNAADLRACQNDAQSFALALKQLYGTSCDVYLRVQPIFGGTKTDKKPTKQQILDDFELIRSVAAAEDRFIFYYAGHGMSMDAVKVDSSDPGEYGEMVLTVQQREYLCPAVAASLSDDEASFKEVFLSDCELRDALISLPCQRKFVLLDCCHSAGMLSAAPDINASILRGFSDSAMSLALKAYFCDNRSEKEAHKNTWILAAAGEIGSSYESAPLGHGFFTYAVLRGFAEADFNGDSFISWSELTAYTAEYSKQVLAKIDPSGNGEEFTDMLVSCGSGSEDILFAPVFRLDDSIY